MLLLEPQDLQNLDQVLRSFIAETNARCALLMDRAGRLLTLAGESGGLDAIAFASLAAADYAASDQLARVLGEDECASLYHQGENRSMFLTDIAGIAVLAAVFDDRTTLGLIRLKTRAVAPEFAALIQDAAERKPRTEGILEGGWAAAAADEIDRLFGE